MSKSGRENLITTKGINLPHCNVITGCRTAVGPNILPLHKYCKNDDLQIPCRKITKLYLNVSTALVSVTGSLAG